METPEFPRASPTPWGPLLAVQQPLLCLPGAPHPHPPLPCRTLESSPGGSLAGAGRGRWPLAPSSGPLSRPWPRPRSGCCSSWGVGAMRGVPRGPLWPGPCTGPGRPMTARFNPPSRPPEYSPRHAGPSCCLCPPRLGPAWGCPHTPLAIIAAAHRRAQLPLPGSLALWGEGTPTSTVMSPAR